MAAQSYFPRWRPKPEDWGVGDWEDAGTLAEEWQTKEVIPETVARPRPSRLVQLLGILIGSIGFPGIFPGAGIAAFYAMGQREWDKQGFWPAGVLGIIDMVLGLALFMLGWMIFEYGRKRKKASTSAST